MCQLKPSLDHARAERDKCAAYEGPDVWGAFMGWADWSVEVRILEAMKSEESGEAGSGTAHGAHLAIAAANHFVTPPSAERPSERRNGIPRL